MITDHNRRGLDIGGLQPAGGHVESVVEMMLDATQHCDQLLTVDRETSVMWHGVKPATSYRGGPPVRWVTGGAAGVTGIGAGWFGAAPARACVPTRSTRRSRVGRVTAA